MITEIEYSDEEEFDYSFGELHFIIIKTPSYLHAYIESDQELWILNDQIIQGFITNKVETILKSEEGIDLTVSVERQDQIIDILKFHDWPNVRIENNEYFETI